MNQLPEFEPIESLFPQWLCARPIVQSSLPQALHFGLIDQNSLGIKFDWVQQIADLTPEEDRDAAIYRIELAWEQASAVIDMQPFEALHRRPITQELFCRADTLLAHQANEMVARRQPTPVEILAHVMGIAPSYSSMRIQVRFEVRQ